MEVLGMLSSEIIKYALMLLICPLLVILLV